MKTIFLFLLLFILGCKPESKSLDLAAPDESSPIIQSCAPTQDLPMMSIETNSGEDYFGLGAYIGESGGKVWLKTEPYYYSVDPITHEIGGVNQGLIYTDENCTDPFGEVFNYPLHYNGDIYVFQFEGQLYEYPLGGYYGPIIGEYFFKTEYGSCNRCSDVENVREIQLSGAVL